jgi:hypothetical protein
VSGPAPHWGAAFETPKSEVPVECVAPEWRMSLRRPERDRAVGSFAERLVGSAEEISAGERSAWARGDGWAALSTRLSALGKLLGGSLETHTLKSRSGVERHYILWNGPKVEGV